MSAPIHEASEQEFKARMAALREEAEQDSAEIKGTLEKKQPGLIWAIMWGVCWGMWIWTITAGLAYIILSHLLGR